MWWSKPAVIPTEKIHGLYGFFELSDKDAGKSALEVIAHKKPKYEFLFWRGELLQTAEATQTRFAVSREKIKIKGDRFSVRAAFAPKARKGYEVVADIIISGTVQNEELIAPCAVAFTFDPRAILAGILVLLGPMDDPETIASAKRLGLAP